MVDRCKWSLHMIISLSSSAVFQPVIHEPLSKPKFQQNASDEGLFFNGDLSTRDAGEDQKKQGKLLKTNVLDQSQINA